ncbi:MAG: helix-turn-helix domain containing protein [Lachnospiraceae bacterium]|jgi:transposase|nr:helix-turn-helix domain containing protein [Lachnospiraceae bacterium]
MIETEREGSKNMGCLKGIKHRTYTEDEKLKIVKMNVEQYLSSYEISKITRVSEKNIRRWVKQYSEEGIEGLKTKRRGNPFAALHTSKTLTKEERLELENLKLKIENERLKKGYLVKGGGAEKEYVSISDVNMRSSGK